MDEFNAYELHSISQIYDSSLDFIELQKMLSKCDCVFGVPLNIYDPKIEDFYKNYHVLLLQEPESKNQIKVIFKPRSKLVQTLSVGAFFMSQYLGMNTKLPPIAIFKYKGVEGIISYFIDTNSSQSFWDISGDYKLIKKNIDPKCLSDYYVFSYLLGNWDLKWRNVLLIDNQGINDITCIDIDAIAYPGVGDYGAHLFVPWVKSSVTSIPYSSFSEEDSFYLEKKDIDFYLDKLFPFFEFEKDVQDEFIVSKKYALILNLVKSYAFWDRPSVKHYIDKKAWWIRLNENTDGIVAACTEFIDEDTIERLKTLNMDILKIIFNDLDPQNPIVNEEFYTGILERRDNLLLKSKYF